MIKLIFVALLASTQLFAQDTPTTETPALVTEETVETKHFNPREGHVTTYFGFEGMKYEVPYDFKGEKSSFSPKKQELWGGRLGVGKEFYLGKGFNTTSKIEGYFVGTLFSRVLNGGSQDSQIKFAYTKRTGSVYGIDLTQSIGYLYDFKTKNPILEDWALLTLEPFVEAGIGIGRAYNSLNYSYNLSPYNERYQERITDNLTNFRVGAGVNLTSSEGYFFFLKGTLNQYNVNDRKIKGTIKKNSDPDYSSLNSSPGHVKLDPIFVFSLGGGYKF